MGHNNMGMSTDTSYQKNGKQIKATGYANNNDSGSWQKSDDHEENT